MAVAKNITWKAILSSPKHSGFWKGEEGKENQDLKKMGGEEYQVVGNYIHPCQTALLFR